MRELNISHPVHGDATVADVDWDGKDPRLNASMWRGRGWVIKGETAEPKASTFDDLVKEDWREAFAAANLGTVEAIAAATVDQIDAIDVKGLGKKKAADLIAAAKAALA